MSFSRHHPDDPIHLLIPGPAKLHSLPFTILSWYMIIVMLFISSHLPSLPSFLAKTDTWKAGMCWVYWTFLWDKMQGIHYYVLTQGSLLLTQGSLCWTWPWFSLLTVGACLRWIKTFRSLSDTNSLSLSSPCLWSVGMVCCRFASCV